MTRAQIEKERGDQYALVILDLRAQLAERDRRIAELEKYDRDWHDYVNTIRLNIPLEKSIGIIGPMGVATGYHYAANPFVWVVEFGYNRAARR